jgi:membrane protein
MTEGDQLDGAFPRDPVSEGATGEGGTEGAAGPPATRGFGALVGRSRARVEAGQARLNELIEKYHDRPLLDVGLRIYQRDVESAGSVVGSALAFRLFLLFVPMTLFVVGLLGFLAEWVGASDVNDAIGLNGTLASEINTALTQPNSTRWIATFAGLFGMIWAGRSLSKVMVSASCLAWRIPVTTKASLRVVGSVVGLVATMALVATVINRIRLDLGLAVAGLSFLATVVIYGIAWMVISMLLPRATRDPGALLPGAFLLGAVLAGMEAISQLYLPDKLGRASALYGALATTIVTLGWFFFIGRAMIFGLSLDAVIYERFGSISQFVFRLPIVRVLPRRSSWLRTFFDLEQDAGEGADEAG